MLFPLLPPPLLLLLLLLLFLHLLVVLAELPRGRLLDQEVTGQPLSVALGDEAALVGPCGQDPRLLKGQQLGGRAGRAVDLELLAGLADLLPMELGQGLAEDLGEAEAELAANAGERKASWKSKKLLPLVYCGCALT